MFCVSPNACWDRLKCPCDTEQEKAGVGTGCIDYFVEKYIYDLYIQLFTAEHSLN